MTEERSGAGFPSPLCGGGAPRRVRSTRTGAGEGRRDAAPERARHDARTSPEAWFPLPARLRSPPSPRRGLRIHTSWFERFSFEGSAPLLPLVGRSRRWGWCRIGLSGASAPTIPSTYPSRGRGSALTFNGLASEEKCESASPQRGEGENPLKSTHGQPSAREDEKKACVLLVSTDLTCTVDPGEIHRTTPTTPAATPRSRCGGSRLGEDQAGALARRHDVVAQVQEVDRFHNPSAMTRASSSLISAYLRKYESGSRKAVWRRRRKRLTYQRCRSSSWASR